jgi:hypothetical protein
MMIYFFFTLIVLALIHFIYEGIVAPSLRLNLRYHLFALRDDLRKLKYDDGEQLTDEVFLLLQGVINNAILLLHRVNLEVVVKTEIRVEKDKELAGRIAERIALVENCDIEAIRHIQEKACRILTVALLVNNGAWIIYIIPIFVIVFGAKRITNFVKEAVAFPESDINDIIPVN